MNHSVRVLVMRLLCLFKGYSMQLLVIGVCLIVVATVSVTLPIINKSIIDDGIVLENFQYVLKLSLLLVFVAIINAGADIVKDVVMATIYCGIQSKLYAKAMKSLFYVEMSYFNTRNSAGMYNIIETDVSRISSICDSNVLFVITQLLTLIGGMIGLLIIDYRLAIVVTFFFPFKILVTLILSKYKKSFFEVMIEMHAQLSHWFGDRVEGMKDVRLFCFRTHTLQQSSQRIKQMTDQERRIIILDSINGIFDSFIVKVLESTLFVVGAYYILGKTLTIGSLFAFVTYSVNVMTPLSAVLGVNYMLSGVLPSASRFFDFIDDAEKHKEHSGNIDIHNISHIEFCNVSFSYNDKTILSNVSFSIREGERVAIIGKNGSGKTTIFNLLQGFICSKEGTILINGMNILDLNIEQYRNCFCCINQSNHLFDMSITENITLFDTYSQAQLDEIINQSKLQPVLDSCSSTVGMNGGHLSGGQRQKVLFARLLFRQKNLILLDEATANFDSDSEDMLISSLSTTFKGKTVISIVHNEKLLSNMDKIIELDGSGGIKIYTSYEQFLHTHMDK